MQYLVSNVIKIYICFVLIINSVNPWETNLVGEPIASPAPLPERGGQCEKTGSGYRIVCLSCKMDAKSTEYEGETARNADIRGVEHMNYLRLEDEENPLWKNPA